MKAVPGSQVSDISQLSWEDTMVGMEDKEIKIKTVLRYHHIPTTMDTVKKMVNIKCWKGYRETRTCICAGGSVYWCGHFGKLVL